MTDLFGNGEPAQKVRVTVYKNRTVQNQDLLPAQTAQSMDYDFTKIRKTFHNGQWYFAYMDVISVLTGSKSPRRYATELKNKLQAEGSEVFGHIEQLKIIAPDGKLRSTQCLSREDTFRLIEEIPSPKAEPFKQWIAHLAHERLEEIEHPEKGIDNAVEAYRRQGKSDKWIRERLKGKAKFITMTDALKSHGAENYAVLIDEQHRHAFNLSVKDHKALKRIEEKGSLRDGMNEWELFVQEAADTASKWLLDEQEAEGQSDCKKSMADGGDLAATLRLGMEAKLGRKVIDAIDYRKITA